MPRNYFQAGVELVQAHRADVRAKPDPSRVYVLTVGGAVYGIYRKVLAAAIRVEQLLSSPEFRAGKLQHCEQSGRRVWEVEGVVIVIEERNIE